MTALKWWMISGANPCYTTNTIVSTHTVLKKKPGFWLCIKCSSSHKEESMAEIRIPEHLTWSSNHFVPLSEEIQKQGQCSFCLHWLFSFVRDLTGKIFVMVHGLKKKQTKKTKTKQNQNTYIPKKGIAYVNAVLSQCVSRHRDQSYSYYNEILQFQFSQDLRSSFNFILLRPVQQFLSQFIKIQFF